MTTAIQRRRGTATQHETFTGLQAELTIDTTDYRVVVHDGVTAGGHPMAKESEVSGFATAEDAALTGTPTAPTAAQGTDTTQIATTAFVRAEQAALVDSAPAALDTLNELAAALGDDPNFATTVTNNLALKAPLASPTFTGNPIAPTQATSDQSTRIATTAYVKAAIADDSSSSAGINDSLFAFKIADLEGVRLNMVGGIADAYDSEDDVDTAASANESYDAGNDLYSPDVVASTEVAFTDDDGSTSGLTTYTFSDVPAGAADADRYLVACFHIGDSGNRTFNSCTIGGVSATKLAAVDGVAHPVAMYGAAVPTGTTATVAVTLNGAASRASMRLHRLVGVNATPIDTATSSSDPGTLDVDVQAGGVVVALGGSSATTISSIAWTGLTGTSGLTNFATSWLGSAVGEFAATALNSAISADFTGSAVAETRSVAVSFAPLVAPEPADMTLVSEAFTATAVPPTARVAVFVDPQESITINTDLTVEVSRDGGSTWTAATLASVSNPVGTVEQYEDNDIDISGQPSGTSMKYRIKTLNNKDIDVTGIVFQWSND